MLEQQRVGTVFASFALYLSTAPSTALTVFKRCASSRRRVQNAATLCGPKASFAGLSLLGKLHFSDTEQPIRYETAWQELKLSLL